MYIALFFVNSVLKRFLFLDCLHNLSQSLEQHCLTLFHWPLVYSGSGSSVRLFYLSESSLWVWCRFSPASFGSTCWGSAHSRSTLMDSYPWLLRSYHELWLTALALGSPFRAHGTCAVKIRKVTLGESLLRCDVALNTVADAQNCFREYSSGTANFKGCFQDCR